MKEKIPNEIETDSLLRGTSANYIRLISDADRKARILIVVNSILLTISITWLTKIFHQGRPTFVPLILLSVSNLLSLLFTILSVKPDLRIGVGEGTEDNILHYKKCSVYSVREYEAHMMNTMNSNEKKLEAMIKELHYFGNLLTRQYRFLKMAYRFFYWGLLLSVVSYILILLLFTGYSTGSATGE